MPNEQEIERLRVKVDITIKFVNHVGPADPGLLAELGLETFTLLQPSHWMGAKILHPADFTPEGTRWLYEGKRSGEAEEVWHVQRSYPSTNLANHDPDWILRDRLAVYYSGEQAATIRGTVNSFGRQSPINLGLHGHQKVYAALLGYVANVPK